MTNIVCNIVYTLCIVYCPGDMLRAEAEKSSPQGAAAGRKKMLRKRRPHASVPDRSPSLKRSAEQRGHAAGSLQGQSAKGEGHVEKYASFH